MPGKHEYLHICFLMFMVVGLNGFILPYWPHWIESHTNDHEQIGFIFSFSMVVRSVATLTVGMAISRRGRVKQSLVMIASFLLLGYLALWWWGGDVLPALYFSAFLCGAYYALVPLIEHLSTQRAKAWGWDYANIRLWGSFSFGVFNMAGAYLFLSLDITLLPPMLALTALFLLLPALLLKEQREVQTSQMPKLDWLNILKKFWPILAPSLLIQMSHSYYYSFSTILWTAQGVPSFWVGTLWTVGVAAEIVFFMFCRKLLRWMTLSQIMSLAAVACVVRWIVLAFTSHLAALVAVQCLHAFTFGAAFYAAMVYIMGHLNSRQAAFAQALYAMLLSLVGLGLPGVFLGYGYEAFAEKNYLIMAVLALLACGSANLPRIKNNMNAPAE